MLRLLLRFVRLAVAATLSAGASHPIARWLPSHPSKVYVIAREGILGTSLDMTLAAPSEAQANRAETAVLEETERLRRILSSYDDASEVSRLARTGQIARPSADLLVVLHLYDRWAWLSGGAYSARVGLLSRVWKDAERMNRVPTDSALQNAVRAAATPGWVSDSARNVLRSTTRDRLDLSSLGKGYVLDHATAAAKRAAALQGGLLNLGGDIRVWGRSAAPDGLWRVGVADPRAPADNAPPLTRLRLTDAAVSSSGSYLRGFDVGGHHYSHIIDARDGRPANAVAGVTVIARENATANALATILSIVGPDTGMRLLRDAPGSEALFVLASGRVIRSSGFAAYEEPLSVRAPRSAPAIHAVLDLDITPNQRVRRRPYVAVWVADARGVHIRTLAAWGDRYKYQLDLSRWWDLVRDDQALIDAVSRATRNAGKYKLEWDGLDQRGNAVPAGVYTFWVEAAYQNGPHSSRGTPVTCAAARAGGGSAPPAATALIDATDAFATGRIVCSPAAP